MSTAKHWLTDKQVLFNLVALVFGAIEANLHLLQAFVGPEFYAYAAFGLGIVNAVIAGVRSQQRLAMLHGDRP